MPGISVCGGQAAWTVDERRLPPAYGTRLLLPAALATSEPPFDASCMKPVAATQLLEGTILLEAMITHNTGFIFRSREFTV